MANPRIIIANPRSFGANPQPGSSQESSSISLSPPPLRSTLLLPKATSTLQDIGDANADEDQLPETTRLEATSPRMDAIITINTDEDIIHPHQALPVPNLQDEKFDREELCFNLYIFDLYERSRALVNELNVVLAVCVEEKDYRNATMRKMLEDFNAREEALRRVGTSMPADVRAIHNNTIFQLYDVGVLMWECYWTTAMKSKAETVAFYERCLTEGPEFVLGDDIEDEAEASARRMRPLPDVPVALFLRDAHKPEIIQQAKDYCEEHGINPELSNPSKDLRNVHDYVSEPMPVGPQDHTVELPPALVSEKIDLPDNILSDHIRSCVDSLNTNNDGENLASLIIHSPRAGDPLLIFSSPLAGGTPSENVPSQPIPLPYILNVQASLEHNLIRERTLILEQLETKIDPVTRILREPIILPEPEILWPAGPSEHPIMLHTYASGIKPQLIPVDLGRAGLIDPGVHEQDILDLVGEYDRALGNIGWISREDQDISGLGLGPLKRALERIAGLVEGIEGDPPFRIMVPNVKIGSADFIVRVHEECYRRIPHSRGVGTVVTDEDGEKLFEVKAMNGIWATIFENNRGGRKCYSMLFTEVEEEEKEKTGGVWGSVGLNLSDVGNNRCVDNDEGDEEEGVYSIEECEGGGDFMDVD
ncbi:hypothetical protein BJ508DRAFT_376708 [Ascobolus immersus RN42]|uniref:Uncharacterized protein n=1 Tax=Ascobolus immersus RN42 TaxID=1160509 RepID=A0A3N4IH45_ASCIM|nr:hypothetical protein BJ508DRAFT_376708 [Ascobolus immersus RN42]